MDSRYACLVNLSVSRVAGWDVRSAMTWTGRDKLADPILSCETLVPSGHDQIMLKMERIALRIATKSATRYVLRGLPWSADQEPPAQSGR